MSSRLGESTVFKISGGSLLGPILAPFWDPFGTPRGPLYSPKEPKGGQEGVQEGVPKRDRFLTPPFSQWRLLSVKLPRVRIYAMTPFKLFVNLVPDEVPTMRYRNTV